MVITYFTFMSITPLLLCIDIVALQFKAFYNTLSPGTERSLEECQEQGRGGRSVGNPASTTSLSTSAKANSPVNTTSNYSFDS